MSYITKCESCGGNYKFDADTGTLTCDKCGAHQPIEAVVAEPKVILTSTSAPCPNEDDGQEEFRCPNCAAPIQASQVIDSKCPYCGANNLNVVENSLTALPHDIIPFAISKDRAIGIYKAWIKKRKFAPNDLKKKSSIQKMQGLYYPCWLFDYNTSTHYSGVGITVHHHRDSEGRSYTTESRHSFNGNTAGSFYNQLEPANSMLSRENVEQFVDFSHQNFVKFDSKYLLGFNVLNYNTDLLSCWEAEKGQKSNQIAHDIQRSLGYDRYASFNSDTEFNNVRWNYSMLPIWSCEFKYKKKKYNFFVNGKTGTIKGKTPKSGWKIFSLVAGIIAGIGAIAALIYFL